MSKKNWANAALLSVSMIWGASYPITRIALAGMSPAAFVLARFVLATLLLLPLAWRHLHDRAAMRLGLVLGVIEGAVATLLSWRLVTMSPSRCAFVVGTSVIWVPIFTSLLRRRPLARGDSLRASISLFGLAILTRTGPQQFGADDAWVLLAGALWALAVVLLKWGSERQPLHAPTVAFYQALCICPTAAVLLLGATPPLWGSLPLRSLLGIGYCALFCTVFNFVVQVRCQRHTTAAQASLRLSLDPLFACLFSTLLLGERWTLQMGFGAAIMLAAMLLPTLRARRSKAAPTPTTATPQVKSVKPHTARAPHGAQAPIALTFKVNSP